MKVIDCRGLQCPAPVIMTKNTVQESLGDSVRVILDNGAARENVLLLCSSKGFTVTEEVGDNCTTLTITSQLQGCVIETPPLNSNSPVLLIASDKLGSGADELGQLLMKNFIITLLELKNKPEKILFLNSGVLLTTEGSELLEPLQKLSASGVEILSCGVCLDYYGRREKLAAGTVTNMYTIVESIFSSANAVRL